MKHKFFLKTVGLLFVCLVVWFIIQGIFWYRDTEEARAAQQAQDAAIVSIIDARRSMDISTVQVDDIFDEVGLMRILLIGLDKRTGQVEGHCDAIQLITIDKEKNLVDITAVPRGSYSTLPLGTAVTSSDYYVSNACALGGLEYGIEQIEKLLGQKADYIVVVGFSEILGILRTLRLPTTETLQWLRHRQGYSIGEPQRAHNHSTFIKQMMMRFIPADVGNVDTALHYIMYKIIQTDLTFEQTQHIVDVLSYMDLSNHPDRIRLSMRPYYAVQDIPYVEEQAGEYVQHMVEPIKQWITSHGYTGVTVEEAQQYILDQIEKQKDDPVFISWAYNNNLWFQIEDETTRLNVQYELIETYVDSLSDRVDREKIIADYILEMEYYAAEEWVKKGKKLLQKNL